MDDSLCEQLRQGINEMMAFNEELVSMTLKESSGDVVFIRDAIKNINHVGCLNEIYEMVSDQLKTLNKNR